MVTALAAPEEFGDLFETLDQMTVRELSQFIKRFEERFDVTAQPSPQVTTAVTSEEAAPVVEEQTEFTAFLVEIGQSKIPVIKVVREVTQLGLKEAKDLVDAAPGPVKVDVDRTEAEKIKVALEAVGAVVEIR